jgi:hypothetical protein
MPGTPEECRQHALECVRRAQSSTTLVGREYFAKLARTWMMLAHDLEEHRAALSEVVDGSEPDKRTA